MIDDDDDDDGQMLIVQKCQLSIQHRNTVTINVITTTSKKSSHPPGFPYRRRGLAWVERLMLKTAVSSG